MKTTDSRDPLDRKIDDLLASRPLRPSDDFAARVLAAVDELPGEKPTSSPIGQILRFALPIAALIVVALTLSQFISIQPIEDQVTEVAVIERPAPLADVQTLSTIDVQEIFLLEEGLASLTQLNDDSLNSADLLSTLDALTFEI